MTLASDGLQNAKAYRWSYADATARGAATGFTADDVGALALQLDNATLWILTATTPTWAAAAGTGFSNPMTTAGDLILGGSGGSAGRLAKGSDSTVLTIDPSTHLPVWAAAGGSGAPTTAKYVTTAADATLSAEVAIPGLAAHADRSGIGGSTFSEEFDGSDPFTYSASPSAADTNSTYASHWYATNGSNTDLLALRAYTPGGDFDVRAKVGMGGIGGTGASIGLIVTDSGNANIAALLLANAADAARTITSYKNSGFTTVAGPVTVGTLTTLYLRITRASNTARYWWSNDGIVWERIGEATSLSTTVAKVGLRFNSGASARYFIADWLRGITGTPVQA